MKYKNPQFYMIHNIIQTHNNVLWDRQYSAQYCQSHRTLLWIWIMSCRILMKNNMLFRIFLCTLMFQEYLLTLSITFKSFATKLHRWLSSIPHEVLTSRDILTYWLLQDPSRSFYAHNFPLVFSICASNQSQWVSSKTIKVMIIMNFQSFHF